MLYIQGFSCLRLLGEFVGPGCTAGQLLNLPSFPTFPGNRGRMIPQALQVFPQSLAIPRQHRHALIVPA